MTHLKKVIFEKEPSMKRKNLQETLQKLTENKLSILALKIEQKSVTIHAVNELLNVSKRKLNFTSNLKSETYATASKFRFRRAIPFGSKKIRGIWTISAKFAIIE